MATASATTQSDANRRFPVSDRMHTISYQRGKLVGPSLGGEDARSYLSRCSKDKSEREPTQHHKDNAEEKYSLARARPPAAAATNVNSVFAFTFELPVKTGFGTSERPDPPGPYDGPPPVGDLCQCGQSSCCAGNA